MLNFVVIDCIFSIFTITICYFIYCLLIICFAVVVGRGGGGGGGGDFFFRGGSGKMEGCWCFELG